MDKDIARLLLPLVNNQEAFQALQDYIRYRTEYHKIGLVNALDWDNVKSSQGAIRELSRMVTLREEVLQKLKEE